MRVTKRVRVIGGVHNKDLVLQDTDGKTYTWNTKSKISPLVKASGEDIYFNVRMDIRETMYGRMFANNVRILKEGQNV